MNGKHRFDKHRFGFVVLMLTLIVASSCNALAPAPAPATTTEVAPATPAVRTEGVVSAEAVIAPRQETTLSFDVIGRVAKVLVEEGDQVAPGQPLVQLATRDLELAVKQAEAALGTARAQLARSQAGPRAEDVGPYEAAVKIAETNVATAEEAVKVREAGVTAANAALIAAQAQLRRVQAGSTKLEIQIAEQAVERARNELWGLQKQRDASRNTLEGQIAAAETAVRIAELQLEQVKAGPRTEDVAIARAGVSQAEGAVKTAEAQVEQARAQVDTARAQLAQAQRELSLAQAGARREDVAVAQAAVTQAEVNVEAAKNALADAELVAPFGGTIGALLVDVGALVSPQVPVLRLGDLTRLQARTEDLSEVDVSQVQPGQGARITVDALEGMVFTGKVLRIVPIAGERRGDKVYTVLVELEAGQESGLRWGMSALAEIRTR